MESEGKYKLLMIRTKYLKNTLNLSKDIFEKAYVLFMKELYKNINETKRPSQKQKKPPENSSISKEERVNKQLDDERTVVEKEEKDENLKQVFKKIALETHPDKLGSLPEFEKNYKTSLFQKARIAFEENDYYAIVEIAEELDIEPPPPNKKQIKMMKTTNELLEKEINKIENTLVWAWYHGEEDKKKKLMEQYIAYLEKNCART